ncbi:MAG: aldehyde dehydrogenase family protein [Comamonas sp.]|jgi:aldehyde dehydrogenase (NAD+)|uniref:L-piperidine-6-carboxylate dehydrogenase n=1 Tax=Comamonas sp. TaxID=34028 RepID=UPI002825EA67|nr:aldehyde dehydrogenase family protein [Comamonas sp.]MDR0215379.1 aldehyde dehydrogenase family protein [Comamonas sp.]
MTETLFTQFQAALTRCGIDLQALQGTDITVRSPIDGSQLAQLAALSAAQMPELISRSTQTFKQWRLVPAPVRGDLVRLWGEELRRTKADIGHIVSCEVGKIVQEGLGEVQEAVDICEFALGLSRQLYGKTMVSERPGHRIMEQYHPLGPVAIITAFNFPSAVFAWNAAIALVCGNPVIFKPSEKAPLSGLATFKALERAMARFGDRAPAELAQIVLGRRDTAETLVDSPQIALVSATGSSRMGRTVGPKVAARFGKRILELGGNNAMVVTPAADLDIAVRAIVFSAVGTAGQRCTTLRRLIVHRDIKQALLDKLLPTYHRLPIGNPLQPDTLVGPLIDEASFDAMQNSLAQALQDGGQLLTGGQRQLQQEFPQGFYVTPAIVDMPAQTAIVQRETFAPVLYVLTYEELEQAIALNNNVPQGLSSCIFSNDLREVEAFLGAAGSDCGMANVNIGPSGAEIGGAFGGEKETGGDRESGSDAWKQYMRRTTNTVNFSRELPLAQGIQFG